MDNTIHQYAIGEFLDGRYFYIPAYQRGYRWTEKQVGDLLRDLLCFANDFDKKKDDTPDQFYSLQPIIASPITDENKLRFIFKGEFNDDIVKRGVWEVIDGQQRLTTIYLLYKYILDQRGWDAEKLKEEEDGKELYHIYYATREGSTQFLESISMKNASNEENFKQNVDYYHMFIAYQYIDEWIKNDGKKINKRYQLGGSLDKIRTAFFDLLNGMQEAKGGSVQVLWYEIAESKETNNIKEFQKINTGKIKLTEAELIKGLFLLKKNFADGDKYIKQAELALEWEFIENTLHADNFWSFLQKGSDDMPNRIGFLFNVLYKLQKENKTKDESEDAVFRFYYDRFDGKIGQDLQLEVAKAWNEVMELFRILDDWFSSPTTYNYVGLLSQFDQDLSELVVEFKKMPEDSTKEKFESYLKKRIVEHLNLAKYIDREKKQITISHPKDSNLIRKLLLTVNIHLLNEKINKQNEEINKQNEKRESELDIYKFPFHLFNDPQEWDIEHIDSSRTNELKKEKDKKEWIETAVADLSEKLSQEEQEEYKKSTDYDGVIAILKKVAQEAEVDEETKNAIGNLTLLDAPTNRAYKNSLFCTKRRIIIEHIKDGRFVPIATQYVFAKFFDEKGTNRSIWTLKDMEAYYKFIYDIIVKYV